MLDQLNGIDPEMLANMWRVSPAATAATLTAEDQRPYIVYPHVKIVSDAVRNAVAGTGPRYLIINMPPQFGKSTTCSIWTPVWYLNNWPWKKVIVCGYGNSFAAEFGGTVRDIVAKNRGTLSFHLSESSQAKNSWKTNHDGAMYSAGIGGQVTGKGANLLIIDDPVKNRDEAESLVERERVWGFWQTTASSRIAKDAVVLIILTRWHEDDLAGRLMDPKYNPDYKLWHTIVLPAFCDSPNDALGRKIGESLCPDLFPDDFLRFKMNAAGGDAAALYQQKPRGEDGAGNVYGNYHSDGNMVRLDRDPALPLCWSLDFNRDPFSTVIAQFREFWGEFAHLTNEKIVQIEVLTELIRHDVDTETMCRAFVDATKKYVNMQRGRVPLHIYGDTSGNQKRTSAGDDTDWIIVKNFFKRYPEYKVRYFVGNSNPNIKGRTNSVNNALKTIDGYRHLKIDPSCVELEKDFLEVRWARDAHGNPLPTIDKKDSARTHVSDALGYLVWQLLGLRQSAGEGTGLLQ